MKRPVATYGKPLDNAEIYEALFAFVDDVLFEYSANEIAEDKITQDIALSLGEETYARDTCFVFSNQYKERNVTTDIGVCLKSSRNCFCWIEAKRLPTPTAKDRDEREYVIVDKKKFNGGGGIQRFKECSHAPNRPYSIMFGYIQDNNHADFWLEKINSWIAELANTENGFWTSEDSLNKYNSNKCSRFLSVHKRISGDSITLHHYWIKL
jgi:hypothetical protein